MRRMNDKIQESEEYIEIDLKEYLYILWKNKILIVSIIILAVLGAYLFSNYVMTNIYSVESSIKLTNLEGSLYSNGAAASRIIKSRSFLQNVNEEYDLNLDSDHIDRLLSDEANFLSVSGNEDSSFIVIRVKGENPNQINNIANDIAQYFIGQTEEDVENKRAVMREHINSLEQEKNNISNLNGNISELIENIAESNVDNQIEINYLQNTLFDIKKSVNEFSFQTTNQIYEIKNELNSISPAQIVSAAEVPENPSEPNIKLNLAIAFVLGVFLAIFIVFIKQFLKGTDWSEYEDK